MDWLNSLFGRRLTAAFLAASLVSGSPIVASADPIADFYKGNTVHLLVGTGVGGEYDLNARLIARFIGDHIPGNPTVIVQNMTGASGMTMDGYLYSVAPQDGTYLGTVMNNFPMYQAMNRPGIKFDVTKFQWVGSIAPVLETVVTWHTTGVKSIDDARKKQIVVGAVGKDSIHYILYVMLNQYLHTQFKIIAGYQSGNELDLAMERGEAEGRIITWSALKTNKPEWLRQMQVNILVQLGPKAPDLPDVPSIMANRGTGRDLIVLKATIVDEEFAKLDLHLHSVRGTRRMVSPTAFEAGGAAGVALAINPGIETSQGNRTSR